MYQNFKQTLLVLQCSRNLTNPWVWLLPKSTSSTFTKSPLRAENPTFSGEDTDKSTAQNASKLANSVKNSMLFLWRGLNSSLEKNEFSLAPSPELQPRKINLSQPPHQTHSAVGRGTLPASHPSPPTKPSGSAPVRSPTIPVRFTPMCQPVPKNQLGPFGQYRYTCYPGLRKLNRYTKKLSLR